MSNTSAIRVSISRALSESEKEWIRDLVRSGERTIAFTDWNGFTYKWTTYPFHIRLSQRGKFWIHSDTVESRRLYRIFLRFLEGNFVNVHPTAVRTFSSIAVTRDKGSVIEDIFEEQAIKRGWKKKANQEMTVVIEDVDWAKEREMWQDEGTEEWEVVGLVDV